MIISYSIDFISNKNNFLNPEYVIYCIKYLKQMIQLFFSR